MITAGDKLVRPPWISLVLMITLPRLLVTSINCLSISLVARVVTDETVIDDAVLTAILSEMSTVVPASTIAAKKVLDSNTHVGHVQLKHYGFRARLIFTFVFLLVYPASFIGSEQDYYQTEDKETLCNPAYDL